MQQTILVVEDEKSIQHVIHTYLKSAGFRVLITDNGIDALKLARQEQPDLIVLDIMLPSMDGMELTARLRQESEVYILMLTALGEESNRVAGLRMGADDYMVKPFSPRELVARIEAILRRHRQAKSTNHNLHFKHLSIDNERHQISTANQILDLTATEFKTLLALARHAGFVLTREQLIEQVWGIDFYGTDRVVDVYVGQVRRKLLEATGETLIQTVRGVGYKFVDQRE